MNMDTENQSIFSEEEEDDENENNNTEDLAATGGLGSVGQPGYSRRRIGSARTGSSKKTMFYFNFIIGTLVIEAYFVTDFIISKSTMHNFTDLI